MANSSGGSAAAGGMEFQCRVSTWAAIQILAEKAVAPPWDLSEETTFEWVRCETGQPVDDLLIGTSTNGYIFVQVKRTLNLSKDPGSDLASALDQFVRQFVANRSKPFDSLPWKRPLDLQIDRLVLCTSPTSSAPITRDFPKLLTRIRHLVQGESLDDAAKTAEERRILEIVRTHLQAFWQQATGNAPLAQDLQSLLSFVYVHNLAVEAGGGDELLSQGFLRQYVITEPSQAALAWSYLMGVCSTLSAQRLGIDRFRLRTELLNAGITLQVPQGYQRDIERLQAYSFDTFDALTHLSEIRVGATRLRIHRECTLALRQAAEKMSLLVVGEPGTGKSGVLHELVAILRDEGRSFIFLAVDRLDARSLGRLRIELGLDHEFLDVLRHWQALQPSFLIIDALDAARGEPAAAMMDELIRRAIEHVGTWRVISSIRQFDLRYNAGLRAFFPGSPPTSFQISEFSRVQHLSVPRLSTDELQHITAQSLQLELLIKEASTDLRDLVKTPFNLKLLAELLVGGVDVTELIPIKTQLDLLDKYWSSRVIQTNDQGDAREAILRMMCERMVADRSLQINRSAIAHLDTSGQLRALLRLGVIIEWQPSLDVLPDRYTLAFAHHILFDYGIARLLLRGTPERMTPLLTSDPDLVVVIQPSLRLHFHHLWAYDAQHQQFWDLVLKIAGLSNIPEIGKLMGPSVAAQLTKRLPDLSPLCVALDDPRQAMRHVGTQAFKHVISALLANISTEYPLQGPHAGPWCELLAHASRTLSSELAYIVRPLLAALCDHPDLFTSDQKAKTGYVARQLLNFAWSLTPYDPGLVAHSLQGVCRTFGSDPITSALLIQRCLEPAHLAQFGYSELPKLAQEIQQVLPYDSDLVRNIYQSAFAYEETSRETTAIGTSRIMALTSNRLQDYELTFYILGEAFSSFLHHAPVTATYALVAVVDIYNTQQQTSSFGKPQDAQFDFNGNEVYLRIDLSAMWDTGRTYHRNKPLKLLEVYQDYLAALAGDPQIPSLLDDLIQILITHNRWGVIWRLLLRQAAQFPSTLGQKILPLLWARPILVTPDTNGLAGEFLRIIFPTLKDELRRRIEETIVHLPDGEDDARREIIERSRDSLLNCLPREFIITDVASSLLEATITTDVVGPNDVLSHPSGWRKGSVHLTEEEYNHQQRYIEAETYLKIKELEESVRIFTSTYLNSVPSMEVAVEILPVLKDLHELLARTASEEGVSSNDSDVWRQLTVACTQLARIEGLSYDGSLGLFIQPVLLEASHHPEPTYRLQEDLQFNEFPRWEYAVRIEAAEGLLVLGSQRGCIDDTLLEAIDRLSTDSVPAVRYQIARSTHMLYSTAPEFMWKLISRFCEEEPNRGVLRGLFHGPLAQLAEYAPDQVVILTKIIFDRIQDGTGAEEVQRLCIQHFVSGYIWIDHSDCRQLVFEMVTHLTDYHEHLLHILGDLREILVYETGYSDDPNANKIRQRTLGFLQMLLHSSMAVIRQLEGRYVDLLFNNWPKSDQEVIKSLFHLIDCIAQETYFASGAYEPVGHKSPAQSPLHSPQAIRFYEAAMPIFDQLTSVGLPSATHHLLQTLEFFIPIDPAGIFLRIGRVIRAGKLGGYHYESLAVDLIVRIVERYFAEYRTILRENKDCHRALIEVLDAFVEVGWPSARRLVYSLEVIFR